MARIGFSSVPSQTSEEAKVNSSRGQLAFGRDPEDLARALRVIGAGRDELKVSALGQEGLLREILSELKALNTQMSLLTDEEVEL